MGQYSYLAYYLGYSTYLASAHSTCRLSREAREDTVQYFMQFRPNPYRMEQKSDAPVAEKSDRVDSL
eukprot:scaffold89849_cov68-Attheya_sp.AAC.5